MNKSADIVGISTKNRSVALFLIIQVEVSIRVLIKGNWVDLPIVCY